MNLSTNQLQAPNWTPYKSWLFENEIARTLDSSLPLPSKNLKLKMKLDSHQTLNYQTKTLSEGSIVPTQDK